MRTVDLCISALLRRAFGSLALPQVTNSDNRFHSPIRKNSSERIVQHENRITHRICVQTLISRRRIIGRLWKFNSLKVLDKKSYFILGRIIFKPKEENGTSSNSRSFEFGSKPSEVTERNLS